MTFFGKKVSRGSFLLFLSFTMIAVCLILIVSTVRKGRINRLSQNTLYTQHQRGFTIVLDQEKDIWERLAPELLEEFDDFAIYVPVKDAECDMRGICIRGEIEQPPMQEGKYFDRETSWSGGRYVVVGKDHEKELKEKDGKRYYAFDGENYEVLGIMGTDGDSRINRIVLMDFQSALRRNESCGGDYVLDAASEDVLLEVGQEIDNFVRPPDSAIIYLDQETEEDWITNLLSGDTVMNTLYVMMLASFAICTVLVTMIWLRFRRSLFFAWHLCGCRKWTRYLEIAKRFYRIAGVAFLVGVLAVGALSMFLTDVSVWFSDVATAFVMTIALGTVIGAGTLVMYMRKA